MVNYTNISLKQSDSNFLPLYFLTGKQIAKIAEKAITSYSAAEDKIAIEGVPMGYKLSEAGSPKMCLLALSTCRNLALPSRDWLTQAGPLTIQKT